MELLVDVHLLLEQVTLPTTIPQGNSGGAGAVRSAPFPTTNNEAGGGRW